jgi:hypothetical protein
MFDIKKRIVLAASWTHISILMHVLYRLWLVPASASNSSSSEAQQASLSCVDITPDRTKMNTIQGLVTLINGDIDEQQIKGEPLRNI